MKGYLSLVPAVLFLLLAGCRDQPGTPVQPRHDATSTADIPTEAQRLLNQYAPPAHGAVSGSDMGLADAYFPPPNANGYDIYAVTFVWGQLLPRNANTPNVVDWSGALKANGDALIHTRCLINFESGQDSLLPQTDSSEIVWLSKTAVMDLDGISTVLFVKRQTPSPSAVRLTFATGPITLNFSLEQLKQLVAFYPVDSSGGVAVMARQLIFAGCPGGTMRGDWVKDPTNANQGAFSGIWIDRIGVPFGVMAGRFWTDSAGARLFEGTVSGFLTTQVIARIAGKWLYDDPRMCPLCGSGHGQFVGKIVFNDNGTGEMRGVFGDFTLPPDQKSMPLVGIWKRNCQYSDGDPEIGVQ
jgi:hypothetical protein